MGTANHFLQWRKRAELKQAEAAEKIGVRQGTYSRYESGKSKPRLSILTKIENITGIKRAVLRPDVYGKESRA